MTSKRISFVIACLAISLFAEMCPGQGTSKGPVSKPQRIKVYFYHEPGEHIDLSPVTRVIRSSAPARAAIEALLAGPTAAEEKMGFSGLASALEFAIGSLTIRKGVARINFIASRTWAGFPGDTAPIRFKKAVELTLAQFPNVRRVVVSLNGDLNFDS
jgi:spore germination protein GerM